MSGGANELDMSETILTLEFKNTEDVGVILSRTRQIARLLGFGPDVEAAITGAVSAVAGDALVDAGGGEAELLVEEGGGEQMFVTRLSFSSSWPRTNAGDGGAALAEISRPLDLLEIMPGEEGSTTVLVGMEFPPGTPEVAGVALARIAAELARRSRPDSYFSGIQEQSKELFRTIGDMRERIEELDRLNRELETFAHSVSHDLKAPLSAIMVANAVLRERLRNPPPEGEETDAAWPSEMIDENIRRSAALIDELLALAEAGQVPRDAEEVEVSEVLERVLEERAADIEARGVTVEAARDLGAVVASRSRLYQLFSNLVGNCVRYNESTEPRVVVVYKGRDEEGAHGYVVRDNGPGIPDELLERVFEPFSKGEDGGTGLGLAIAKKIIDAYGGSISAYNDSGACFEFSIRDAGD